ncbi:hypothetical protein [Pseudochryseolinea flava]|nr:hypothetical protein [Pseudochryseolinea flava]
MRYPILVFLITSLVACDSAYDAKKVAARYCDCMRNNGSPENFEKASEICGDRFKAENRYLKLYSVDMRDRVLNNKISNETRDSVKSFVGTFINHTNTQCCEETLACPDSANVK